MAEESALTPKVEKVAFPGKLIGTLDAIKTKVANIPFYMSGIRNNELILARIESRNIHKRPYLFYLVIISGSNMEVVYSVPQDNSDRMRRAQVIKNIASLVSLISDQYQLDQSTFMQYIDSVMENLLNGISETYSTLFNKYDSLLTEYKELKRLNVELSASNRNLTVQTSMLTADNKNLVEQLKTLQTYSDNALMAMVQDWLEVHNETIDIEQFAKTYKLSSPRVEEILDKMVSMGYLRLKG
ncbi:MAG: hypothetical protein M1122_01170 [Candidatus Marsarchaeota archaeon]|nr:hypothetical protein [Candidatus Marsarchaeota archaeon]